MYKLRYSEFHITNVCNLNCTNCHKFNNFAFSGHHLWKDNAKSSAEWAKLVDIDTIAIIGGEPMLNPDFLDWVHGISTLWPSSDIVIVTNGTQLNRWPELYDVLKTYQGRIELEINRHSLLAREETLADVEKFLQGPLTIEVIDKDPDKKLWKNSYNSIKDTSWPPCETPESFDKLPIDVQKECREIHHFSPEIWNKEVNGVRYIDRNQIRVEFFVSDFFENVSVAHDLHTNKLTLQNSDPVQALEVCLAKACHHFIGGKLHKCGPVGLWPEFIQQFPVEITEEDRKLINAYRPATPDWNKSDLDAFIKNLVDAEVIDQCKFCPDSLTATKFEASTKKHKIIKIKSL